MHRRKLTQRIFENGTEEHSCRILVPFTQKMLRHLEEVGEDLCL
jgi:hypothetical protein